MNNVVKERIDEFFNHHDFNRIKKLVLSDTENKKYFINEVCPINCFGFVNNLSMDELNMLFNVDVLFDIDPFILNKVCMKLTRIPESFKNNTRFLFDGLNFKFSNLNYVDAYYLINKGNEYYENYIKTNKKNKKNNFINSKDCNIVFSLFKSFDRNVSKILINNYDNLFVDKFELLGYLSKNVPNFAFDFFNLDNIYLLKEMNDVDKYYVFRKLNYEYDFMNNKVFIDLITSIKSEKVFRSLMFDLEYIIDINYLERIRRKFIRNNIKNYINDELLEVISGYLFGDFYHNVILDINELINYNMINKIVDKDHIKFYQLVCKLYRLNDSDKIKFFEDYKMLDIKGMFYDDLRLCKDNCYKDLMDSSVNLTDDIYDSELSDKYDISVYKLDGKPFFALVKCFIRHLGKDLNDIMNSKDGFCFSYISSSNFGTITDGDNGYTILFSNPDYKNIVHLHRSDSWSNYDRSKNMYASSYTNELFSSNDLSFATRDYNELVISKNDSMKALAYICFDKIRKDDIIYANTLKLPILLIDRRKYKEFKASHYDNDDEEMYLYNNIEEKVL